jgi:hypothetical protein
MKTKSLLTSNCHACFATIFDLFGQVEVALNSNDGFRYLRVKVADAPKAYANRLPDLYGGKISQGVWTVEWDEAEEFAKSIKYFTPRRRTELELFLAACLSNRSEGPLTNQQRRNRATTVEKLRAAEPGFELPKNFLKPVSWAPRSPSRLEAKELIR